MKSCNTSVARQMGYLNRPSIEEDIHGGSVHVLGPSKGRMTSYHQSKSSRQIWKASRDAFLKAGGRKRGRTILYAR